MKKMVEAREHASNSSRRRRWEMKSKESFQKSVAVEGSSPSSKKKETEFINNSIEEEPEEEESIAEYPYNVSSNEDTVQENQKPSAPPDETHSPKEHKKKKKKIPRKSVSPVPPSQIVSQLNKMSDDIIEGLQPVRMPSKAIAGVMMGSGPSSTFNGNISTIYCEKLNNFVVGSENQQGNNLFDNGKSAMKSNTRISFALKMQIAFGSFSLFCQGSLTGLVVAHCIMVFVLDLEEVFAVKESLTQIFHAFICFFSAISLVSAFDRSDIVGQGALSGSGVKIPWTPLFYLANGIISLVMMQGEDFYGNFHLYEEPVKIKSSDMFNWWKFMSAVRTFFVLLAWVAVCRYPNHDALRNKLSSLTQCIDVVK